MLKSTHNTRIIEHFSSDFCAINLRFMKIFGIILAALVFSSLGRKDTHEKLSDALTKFLNDPTLKYANISFEAIDLATGVTLASHNSHTSLSPASVSKLFTTAMALDELGPTYTPKTKFYIDGELKKDGTLKGNLWVRGGGDVSFSSRYYCAEDKEFIAMQSLVDTLKKLGIKKIEGDVISDASDFGYDGNPDGWIWGDMGNYYGAGSSGLTYSDNILKLYYKTGLQSTTVLKMEPVVEDLRFSNFVVADAVDGDNSYVYGAPYSLDRYATGRLPKNQAEFVVKASIPDPELNYCTQLVRNFKDRGVEISGKALGFRTHMTMLKPYKDNPPLYILEGKTILSIAWWTNYKSVNLFAETLLQLGDYNKNGKSSIRTAPDFMEQWVSKKFDNEGLYIKDGSGLSRSSAVSAHHLCELLKWANGSGINKDFRSTLPCAGVSGTVKGLCNNQAASGRFFVKSGTMSRVKSYAGYMDCASGKRLAIAIIVNNFSGSSNTVVDRMEPLFNVLAKQ
jgi:D-alanyl-D-alanine carboxypeptidase/D-alanyl-D-alanine-endopeptidase (penicillin-binding protein 4)